MIRRFVFVVATIVAFATPVFAQQQPASPPVASMPTPRVHIGPPAATLTFEQAFDRLCGHMSEKNADRHDCFMDLLTKNIRVVQRSGYSDELIVTPYPDAPTPTCSGGCYTPHRRDSPPMQYQWHDSPTGVEVPHPLSRPAPAPPK